MTTDGWTPLYDEVSTRLRLAPGRHRLEGHDTPTVEIPTTALQQAWKEAEQRGRGNPA